IPPTGRRLSCTTTPSTCVSHRRWPTRTYWVIRSRDPGGYCGAAGPGIIVFKLSVSSGRAIILKRHQSAGKTLEISGGHGLGRGGGLGGGRLAGGEGFLQTLVLLLGHLVPLGDLVGAVPGLRMGLGVEFAGNQQILHVVNMR